MAVNYDLLQPANIAGNMMAGQQQAQQNQLAKQQLETGALQQQNVRMQMEQAKRDRDALVKLQEQFVANGKSPDLEENADAMIQSGIAHYVDIGMQIKQKVQQQKQFANIMGGSTAPAAPAAPTASVNALAPAAATPETAVNALAPGSDISGLRQKRDALLAMGTQQSIAAAKALDSDIALAAREPVYHNVPNVGLVDPRTGKVIVESKESTQPEIKQYEYAKAQGYKGSLFDFKREMAIANRAPAAPRPESAPVAVVDPATGKQVLVSREEALRGRMTPAAAMESLPPKEIQKREAALPQATSAVQGFESKSDKFIADLKALRDDPGLENITGAIYGRTPSVTREGSRAQALYDKVIAKGGFQALQDLRDASKTGGALGNISNQEGKQLTASFAAIDRRQNAADVRAAIDQAISDIEGTKTRMREAYDSTYSYKNGGASAPAAPPAPAGGTLSPAEQAELAALRKRFGK